MSEDVILVEPCYLVGDTQSKNHLKDRIKDLENELEAYKCANKLLKSTLDEVRGYEC